MNGDEGLRELARRYAAGDAEVREDLIRARIEAGLIPRDLALAAVAFGDHDAQRAIGLNDEDRRAINVGILGQRVAVFPTRRGVDLIREAGALVWRHRDPSDDYRLAISEGWEAVGASGAIERVPEDERFGTDEEASAWVRRRAMAADRHAIRALLWLRGKGGGYDLSIAPGVSDLLRRRRFSRTSYEAAATGEDCIEGPVPEEVMQEAQDIVTRAEREIVDSFLGLRPGA